MRKTSYIMGVIAMLMAMCACQNDGNIGRLFGTWCVNHYSVNGTAVDSVVVGRDKVPVSDITFSFQNNVVNVVTVLDDYQSNYSQFGTWSEEGNAMTLDFTHVDANNEAGTGLYSAPTWLGMISSEKMEMTVSDSKSRSFTLTWTDPEGDVRVYKLHKTW